VIPARPRSAPVYFLHIPKTGGTTVAAYLRGGFEPDRVCPATDWRALASLSRARLASYDLFYGHFGGGLITELPHAPQIVTMLRDPVDQAVSAWCHIRRHPASAGPHLRGVSDFRAYLERRIPNPQCRYLTLDASNLEAGAKRTLSQALAFGFVDRFDDSLAAVAKALAWAPPGGIGVLNGDPGNGGVLQPTAAEIDLVRRHNESDVAVVDWAREEFERRHRCASSAAGYERRLRATAFPLRAPLTIDMDSAFNGSGWLPPHRASARWIRWTGPSRTATVDLPVRLPPETVIEITCASVAAPDLVEGWSLDVNGTPVRLARYREGDELVYRGAIVRASPRLGFTRLSLRTSRTVPFQLSGPRRDTVRVGLAVSRIRLWPGHGHAATASATRPEGTGGLPPGFVAVRPATVRRAHDALARVPPPADNITWPVGAPPGSRW